MTIHRNLTEFFDNSETSEAELAGRLGISRSHMNMLKSGERRPSPELAQKIEEITGIPFRQLLIRDKGNKRKSA